MLVEVEVIADSGLSEILQRVTQKSAIVAVGFGMLIREDVKANLQVS